MALPAGSSILDLDDVVSPEAFVDEDTIATEEDYEEFDNMDDDDILATFDQEEYLPTKTEMDLGIAGEEDSVGAILADFQAEVGAAKRSPARQSQINRARARAAARLRRLRAQRALAARRAAAAAKKAVAKSAAEPSEGGGGGGGGGEEGGGEAPAEGAPPEDTATAEAAAPAEAPSEGEDMTQAPQENVGAAPHQAASGVWLKTHIYQEGPLLKSVTYCVAGGDVEVLRFQVDLRPIARRIARYHHQLHEVAEQSKARPAGLKPRDEAIEGLFDDIVHVVTAPVTAPFKAAKKAIGSAAKAIGRSKLLKSIAHGVGSVVKKVVNVGVMLSPYNLVKHVLAGERIDHALLNDFKDKLKGVKEVAPYVATVTSFVPGIGTGVSAAIAAATAVASGQKITDAFIAAARNAVPGGPAAMAAFDTATNLVRGRPIDKALLDAARNQLPDVAKKAFDVAVALQHGKSLQALASIPLPGIHLPAQLSGISDQAMAAYATANAALHTVARMEEARKAVRNVAKASALVDKMKKAVATVGPTQAKTTFAQNPALKAKLIRAIAVRNAGKRLSLPHLKDAAAKRNLAVGKIKEIHEAAKKGDPNAQMNMRIFDIVAKTRQHLGAIASAHSTGVPGMMIDSRGRLVKGTFMKKTGAPTELIYSITTERGSFVPAKPDPTAPVPPDLLLAQVRPTPMHPAHPAHPVHPAHPAHPARPAMPARPAVPARPALARGPARPAIPARPAAPARKVSGAMPPLVGCPPIGYQSAGYARDQVGYQSAGYARDQVGYQSADYRVEGPMPAMVGCPPVPRVGYQSHGYSVEGPMPAMVGCPPVGYQSAGYARDQVGYQSTGYARDMVGYQSHGYSVEGGPVSIVAEVTPQGSAIDEALASMSGEEQAYVGAAEHGQGPMHKLLVRQRKIRAALIKMQQDRLAEIAATGGNVEAARARMRSTREKLAAQQKRSREVLQHRLRQHYAHKAAKISGQGLGWSELEAMSSGSLDLIGESDLGELLEDPTEEEAIFGAPWGQLIARQRAARHAMAHRQQERLKDIAAHGGDVRAARAKFHARREQLAAAQRHSRQVLRERLAHQ